MSCLVGTGGHTPTLIVRHSGPPFAMGVEVECRHAHPESTDGARAQKGICRVGEGVVAAGGGIGIRLGQEVPGAVVVAVAVAVAVAIHL